MSEWLDSPREVRILKYTMGVCSRTPPDPEPGDTNAFPAGRWGHADERAVYLKAT